MGGGIIIGVRNSQQSIQKRVQKDVVTLYEKRAAMRPDLTNIRPFGSWDFARLLMQF